MIKFKQVKIGTSFRYKGGEYTKTGPFQATAKDSEKAKMVIQAALVIPLDDQGHAVSAATASPSNAALHAAVEAYHHSCLEVLAKVTPEPKALQLELEVLRKRIMDTLPD